MDWMLWWMGPQGQDQIINDGDEDNILGKEEAEPLEVPVLCHK